MTRLAFDFGISKAYMSTFVSSRALSLTLLLLKTLQIPFELFWGSTSSFVSLYSFPQVFPAQESSVCGILDKCGANGFQLS